MSAAYDKLMTRGFTRLKSRIASPTLSLSGVTVDCVSTPIVETREARDTGYWPHFSCIAEITRAELVAMKITDRSIVAFTDADGKTMFLKVLGIDGGKNDGDPNVRLTLKEEPGATAERV